MGGAAVMVKLEAGLYSAIGIPNLRWINTRIQVV